MESCGSGVGEDGSSDVCNKCHARTKYRLKPTQIMPLAHAVRLLLGNDFVLRISPAAVQQAVSLTYSRMNHLSPTLGKATRISVSLP